MGMSLKMENFCRAYVQNGVARTAALEAGYSEGYARCRAYELLDHVGVRMGIEQLRWEMREHNTGDADTGGGFSYDQPRWRQRYLEVLWAVGSTSMEELIVDGEMVAPEPGALAWWAIKSWKQVPAGKGGMTPQIELYDRMSALREFGKATGFNAPLALQPTDATDKNRSFAGESDRGFGLLPQSPQGQSGDWRTRGATDKDRAFAGASDRGIGAMPQQSRMPAGTPAFAGNGAAAPQRPEGRTPTGAAAPQSPQGQSGDWRTRGATDKNRAFAGASDRGFRLPTQSPQGRSGDWRAREATDKDRAFVGRRTDLSGNGVASWAPEAVSSWPEQVAILASQPVEVLESLVVAILNDPVWSADRISARRKGEMIGELLRAVPRDVKAVLLKRLQKEGVGGRW